jgi:hypothetical protein
VDGPDPAAEPMTASIVALTMPRPFVLASTSNTLYHETRISSPHFLKGDVIAVRGDAEFRTAPAEGYAEIRTAPADKLSCRRQLLGLWLHALNPWFYVG